MKIACIGWGSLIWRPENLLIRREWFNDGPFLPIEFVRQSDNGRITLVITDQATPLRTLWALMATESLPDAIESLRIREGIGKKNLKNKISSVTKELETENEIELSIKDWLLSHKLDAAIWTNLSPRFGENEGQVPTAEEIISYFKSIDVNKRIAAEEYIRRTPKQIDTNYRRIIEKELGWTYIGTN